MSSPSSSSPKDDSSVNPPPQQEEKQELENGSAADMKQVEDPPLETVEGDTLDLTHSKVDYIPVEEMRKTPLPIRCLVLRQNNLKTLEGLDQFPELQRLDVYLNHLTYPAVKHILPKMTALQWLDLSFNEIRRIQGLFTRMVDLENLYLIKNKITSMKGIAHLTKLRQIELGNNRIRKIEELEKLTELEELWLALNKIVTIEGLDTLTKLRIVSLQNNRIVEIGDGLKNLVALEELYLAHNGIEKIEPHNFANLKNLKILDLSSNRLKTLENIEMLQNLEELWLSDNQFESWDILEILKKLPKLHTLYLDQSPLSRDNYEAYVERILDELPNLRQLDAEEYEFESDES